MRVLCKLILSSTVVATKREPRIWGGGHVVKGHFVTGHFVTVISSHRHFVKGYFVTGHFVTRTFRYTDVLRQEVLSQGRHKGILSQDILSQGHFVTQTF